MFIIIIRLKNALENGLYATLFTVDMISLCLYTSGKSLSNTVLRSTTH